MQGIKKIIYLLLIVALTASCSVFKKSSKKKKSAPVQTQTTITKPEKSKDTVTVSIPAKKIAPYKSCSFKCKTTFKSMPVTLNVRTTYDSIFWISASSFGIEAIRVKCDRDSLLMTDKLNKENVHWTYQRAAVYAGLPLTFDFIQDLFTDTTLVKSYNTAKFSGTVVKKLTTVQGVRLPEQVNIDGKIKGSQQKIQLSLSNYKLNAKNGYPFEFVKGYKTVK